jgi:hypothetical protein
MGRGKDQCVMTGQWQHTLVFGAVQVLMSMLPNLERCAGWDSGAQAWEEAQNWPKGHFRACT